ncbi:hypothetical protein GCM10007890_10180 [Methylobacterium tardum]|uniref:Uncharacterized protein n=1 Tax=Methylobacterium tardum TaxID=374432 RepID=A0AA37T8Z1_9HYPH|nr:hypothetical protein GCM10007890_10180 [Methylobacterium tardum]
MKACQSRARLCGLEIKIGWGSTQISNNPAKNPRFSMDEAWNGSVLTNRAENAYIGPTGEELVRAWELRVPVHKAASQMRGRSEHQIGAGVIYRC